MKKLFIGIFIVLWLSIGWYGCAIIEGYFWGKYPNCRYEQNTIIPEYIFYTGGQILDMLYGPISFIGHVLFLGNNKENWRYEPRYCYWHEPENK